jgi:hypothetical protein
MTAKPQFPGVMGLRSSGYGQSSRHALVQNLSSILPISDVFHLMGNELVMIYVSATRMMWKGDHHVSEMGNLTVFLVHISINKSN